MKKVNKLLGLSAIGLAAALSTQANAAGYKMEFQSASILADSGEAAVVEDAGTNWYNPAGDVYLPQQLVLSGINVYAPVKFTGSTTAPSTTVPGFGYSSSGNASSHSDSTIAGIHYTFPFNKCWAAGISIVPAWGFVEDYGTQSIVRYDLTRVYVKSLDINPNIAWRFTDKWSVGLGPQFHYLSAESRSNARTEPATPYDSFSRFSAGSWAYGWQAGLLFRPDECTRFGLDYRSKLVHHLGGHSDFAFNTGPGANNFSILESNLFSLNITLPPVTTFSAYRDITPCWAVMGTIAYDQWAVLKNYNAQNYIQPTLTGSTLINVNLPQNMHNTVDYGIGTHYKINDKIMLRANFKYLPTPTNNQDRDINFPDGPKYGIQIGARIQMTKSVKVDMLYGHVFTSAVSINQVNPVTFATTTGRTHTNIDLIGMQLVWDV